jgi:adenylate kinase
MANNSPSKVIAFVGLSGAGKSTFLARLSNHNDFLHLSASDVLKAEFLRRELTPQSSEDLRLGPVSNNQTILVDGFLFESKGYQGTVVFDAHLLIDGSNGVVEIPSWVFTKIKLKHMIFLEIPPLQILQQRQFDTHRTRPIRSVEEIECHQIRAIELATSICSELGVPLSIVGANDFHQVTEILSHF